MLPDVFVAAQIPELETWVAAPYDGDPWSIADAIPNALRLVMGRSCDRNEAEEVIKSLRIVQDLDELVA